MRGDLRALLSGIGIGVGITCFVVASIFAPVKEMDVGEQIEGRWDRQAVFWTRVIVWCMPYTWIHAIAPGFAKRYEWFIWLFIHPILLLLFFSLAGAFKRNV